MATHLLPLATRLLGSRFEDHVLAGLHALDLLTKVDQVHAMLATQHARSCVFGMKG